jgi:tetratricopeptide (TPR) repeat protein
MLNSPIKYIFLVLLFLLHLSGFAQTVPDSLKKDSLANIHLSVAKKYSGKSQTANAFKELFKADALFKQTGNHKGERDVFIAFAKIYEKNMLWGDASTYYQKAFLIPDPTDTTNTTADVAFGLAKALFHQGKYDDALKFDTYSLRLYTEKQQKGKMAECYVNIAAIKNTQKNYDQAEDLILHQALPLFRSAGNDFGRISCFDVLGHLYHAQKRYSEAKWFYIQANMQSRKLKDTVGIITSLINLGKVKIDIKDYDLAIGDFKEADKLSRQKKLLSLQAEAKKAFGLVYQKTGNKNLSVQYLSDYNKLSNVATDTMKNRNIAVTRAKHEAEKTLQQEPERKAPVTNQTALYFLTGLIVLITITAILLFLKRKK